MHLTRALSERTVHCQIESSPGLGIFRDGQWSVTIIVKLARVCGAAARPIRERGKIDTLENLERGHFALSFVDLETGLPPGLVNYWL